MAPTTSRPWPPPSTADRARRSVGERLPRLSTPCCNPVRLVLRRPVETKLDAPEPYRTRLAKHGLKGSMGQRGNPYGSAKAEGFTKTLNHEEVHLNGHA